MCLCWFLFLFLCYSLFCLFSLVFCHRVCACFHFFVVGVFHLYSIYGKNSTNDNCFAPIIMVTLTYLSVYEIYKKHKIVQTIWSCCTMRFVTCWRLNMWWWTGWAFCLKWNVLPKKLKSWINTQTKINWTDILKTSLRCPDLAKMTAEFGETTDELLKERSKLL